MPVAIAGFFSGIGILTAGAFGITVGPVAALAIGVTTVVGVAYTYHRVSSLKDIQNSSRTPSLGVVARSTNSPRNIVYGEQLVGGVLTYANVDGPTTEYRSLYYEVVHTGHTIDSFVGWRIDDRVVYIADVDDINASPPGNGAVTADTNSHNLGPIDASASPLVSLCFLRGHLGSGSQAADNSLTSTFSTDITSNHRHRGRAKTVARFDLLYGAEDRYDGRAPSPPSAIIRGKKVYDPRQDGTLGYSPDGGHRVGSPATWAWSDNPALCLADYLIDSEYGPGIGSSRINYASVASAADVCDTLVDIPPVASPQTQEKRYTCNLVFDTSSEHADVIQLIKDTMAGDLRYFNGQFYIYAGAWEATSFSLDDSDLVGEYTWQKQPSTQRGDRYNQVKGTYIDPDRNWKISPFLTVNNTVLRDSRDNTRELATVLELPGVTGEYQAQRLAFLAINQADDTGVLEFPAGYQAANIRVGDTGVVGLSELGWPASETILTESGEALFTEASEELTADPKTFRCVGVRHVDFEGVVLTLKEDASVNYDDPVIGDYGTRSASGAITFPKARDHRQRFGDSVIADPYFLRGREFNTTTGVYDPTKFWSFFDFAGNHTASFVDGTVGAAVRINVSTDQSGGGLWCMPIGEPMFFDGEDYRINLRMRRISGSTGSGSAFIGVDLYNADRVTGEEQQFSTLSEATISGWTANNWQSLEYTATISASSPQNRVYITPFIYFGSFTQPFTNAAVVEIDMFNITRV